VILQAYKKAENRILFLDYDGTLVPFSDLPGESKLGEEIRHILMNLTRDLKNHIYIISGRDRLFLTHQFLDIPVGLIAEHGFRMKEADGSWNPVISSNNSWKKQIMTFFQELSLLYPGSFVEKKESSVAYHYRMAGKNAGEQIRPVVLKNFLILSNKYPRLSFLDGHLVCEIKPESFNKGRTASAILRKDNFDFIMAAGDDMTDEDLFTELGNDTFTIKIGAPPTHARYYISGQNEFIEFLKYF